MKNNPIYNAFDLYNKDFFKDLPTLDLGNKIGSTDYIDFVKIDDMLSNIMKGVDYYGRHFVSIKYWVTDTTDMTKPYQSVGTFFQRYSDDPDTWAYGTCYPMNMLFYDSRVRLFDYKHLTTRLHMLLKNEKIYSSDFFKLKDDERDICLVPGNGKYIISLNTSI
jgi:hypothetical protein